MAQANVAREPSMDEILASIRRIIESNDPPQAGTAQFPSDSEEDASGHDEASEEIHLTIDDAPASFQPAPEEQIPSFPIQDRFRASEPPVEPPMSLADVAARVRAASERHSSAREADIRDQQPAVSAPRLAASHGVSSPTITARMGLTSGVSRPLAVDADTASATVKVEPLRPVEKLEVTAVETTVAAADTPSIAEPAEALTQPAVQRQSIATIAEKEVLSLVSPVVSQKVAQSFEDLALAVNEDRRSFDEIAEDMMRPMLQEWLDDNLPTLVERLVREEIERVARGPRR